VKFNTNKKRVSTKTNAGIPKPFHRHVIWRNKTLEKLLPGPKDTLSENVVKQTYFPTFFKSLEEID